MCFSGFEQPVVAKRENKRQTHGENLVFQSQQIHKISSLKSEANPHMCCAFFFLSFRASTVAGTFFWHFEDPQLLGLIMSYVYTYGPVASTAECGCFELGQCPDVSPYLWIYMWAVGYDGCYALKQRNNSTRVQARLRIHNTMGLSWAV